MRRFAWVAHASRVLATVFHRRELFRNATQILRATPSGKFVALKQRDQHTRRVRYPSQPAER